MTNRALPALALATVLTIAPTACGDDDTGSAAPTTATTAYDPGITPADFEDPVENEYFPLTPGTRWVYEGESEDGIERIEVTVTDQTREVMGIQATVVRDTVTVDGEVVEDTRDWFAADDEGNVWYFGEAVENFEDGRLEDTDGSWEAGVDGALPGIVMLADPQPGDHYLQEYWPGEAEDEGTVLRVGEDEVSVPGGDFDRLLVTEDVNPLEPGIVENKYYAPGVGMVMEEKVEGGEERVELIEFTSA